MTKYIFVTGGVVSSIGKGITSASIGRMLKNRGLRVTMIKVDPYVNVDAGTMNPYQHGEVFVTDDGAETDLDLGNYERFADLSLNKLNSITTGSVYGSVIAKERRGDYLGRCVQVIPHVTDEIKEAIRRAARDKGADVAVIEVGGTVGDIESLPFLEAIRQFKKEAGPGGSLYIHVTLIPGVGPWNELKTKPTQHSVAKLREVGIHPDILVCRSKSPLSQEMREKLSLFCDVDEEAVIESMDVPSIYEVPLIFEREGFGDLVAKRLYLYDSKPSVADLQEWERVTTAIAQPKRTVEVAIVGKYTDLRDAYMSVIEAIHHGGIANLAKVNLRWVESADLESKPAAELLAGVNGVVVPGGFGERGVEGKLEAVQYARENKIPYLGLCYGLQMAVIEFARNVAGLEGANTTEVDRDTPHPVIHILPEQEQVEEKGATMRLGLYPCRLAEGTVARDVYGEALVYERHRHRFEFNNQYRDELAAKGLVISGTSPDGRLVEIVELKDHPFFVGTQFHPEFRSRPNRAHPLFRRLIEAACANAAPSKRK
ncbi:MAG TPA: CTP synthase [Armatimonadota bacterium]|jgi:CTP synthase